MLNERGGKRESTLKNYFQFLKGITHTHARTHIHNVFLFTSHGEFFFSSKDKGL